MWKFWYSLRAWLGLERVLMARSAGSARQASGRTLEDCIEQATLPQTLNPDSLLVFLSRKRWLREVREQRG
jgi:hypothetical protein